MEILICLLLGVIQGLTEFLPVSSSGHLALAGQAMGLKPRLYLATALHLGTVAVMIFWFRREIAEIVGDVFRSWSRHRQGESFGEQLKKPGGLRTAGLVILACIPTAVLGLAIERYWTQFAASTCVVSALLLVTAALLFVTRYVERDPVVPGVGIALMVGVAQGIAVLPGISRSGATIACALLLSVESKEAARFSFFIAIPAILGAALLEARHLVQMDASQVPAVLCGVFAAAVSGYLALSLLLRTVARKKLHYYSFYLVPLGLFGLIFTFLNR